MSRTDAEILDRSDVDDLDAILAISNTERDQVIHSVADHADEVGNHRGRAADPHAVAHVRGHHTWEHQWRSNETRRA